jgi:uncharacterized protein (TIGR02757 family)
LNRGGGDSFEDRVLAFLEATYRSFNRPEFVPPDPLQLVLERTDPADAELAGFVSSSLAFGRVGGILRASSDLLGRLGPRPSDAVEALSERELAALFSGFCYRIYCEEDIVGLVLGVKRVRARWGSLEKLFLEGLSPSADTVVAAQSAFAAAFRALAPPFAPHLLPAPEGNSACKRSFLFLRWMSRKDAVDPGCWAGVPARLLVVPMDTHMAFAARRLGFLRAAGGVSLRSALEVTARFRELCPEDPVRWDFALTRLGIRPELDREGVFAAFGL